MTNSRPIRCSRLSILVDDVWIQLKLWNGILKTFVFYQNEFWDSKSPHKSVSCIKLRHVFVWSADSVVYQKFRGTHSRSEVGWIIISANFVQFSTFHWLSKNKKNKKRHLAVVFRNCEAECICVKFASNWQSKTKGCSQIHSMVKFDAILNSYNKCKVKTERKVK